MRPREESQSQMDLFRSRLEQILNRKHPLFQLADKVCWDSFDVLIEDCYSEELGAPAKAMRLMVGLHYLKHAFNESDESVVERWVENPYWQYFCGFQYLQHECPIHPTSMTKFRNRVGEERIALLLKQTVEIALREGYASKRECRHVNIDTTVQEKNVAFPTDSKLLHRAIQKLGKAARRRGINLRQSYSRVAKRAHIKASRYAHAKQFRRMNRKIRFLKTRLGRVIRDIERKAGRIDEPLAELLSRCKRLHAQKRSDKNKLYSLHEPDVQCISKGKAHKRYEFGSKVAVATSNRENWFLAAESLDGNPYDGHTLYGTIEMTERITGIAVTDAYVDKGYRGHDYAGGGRVHIAGQSSRGTTCTIRKRRKRRSAVEPKIGHAKSDNRMGRCYLKGIKGDKLNAVLAAAGANFRKLLNAVSFLPVILRTYHWLTARRWALSAQIDYGLPSRLQYQPLAFEFSC